MNDAAAACGKGFPNHCIFVPGYVRALRAPQIEHLFYVRPGLMSAEIMRHKPPDVLGKRDSEFGGTLPGSPMGLGLKRDLGSCHHDGTIIPYLDRFPTGGDRSPDYCLLPACR